MFNKDYSPYDELQELRKFALGADQHIGKL